MFDYVRCEYPLPDDAPPEGWQTKDTPNQYMEKYTITEDGRLVDESGGVLSDFHGDLEFYHSNVSGCGPQGYITDDDKPYRGWTFVARFTDGRLSRLTGGLDIPEGIFAKPNSTRQQFNSQ
jgi:hypothetical protein